MNINALTTSEEALMKVIWTLEQAYMKDILEAYPEPKPHQNTISTYLKILIKKGFLSAKKIGRVNQYRVTIHYETYKKEVIKDLIQNHFEGFSMELFQFCLNHQIFAKNDIKKSLTISNDDVHLKTSESEKISEYLSELIAKTKKKDKKKDKKKKKKSK